jgi:hypothetical protein
MNHTEWCRQWLAQYTDEQARALTARMGAACPSAEVHYNAWFPGAPLKFWQLVYQLGFKPYESQTQHERQLLWLMVDALRVSYQQPIDKANELHALVWAVLCSDDIERPVYHFAVRAARQMCYDSAEYLRKWGRD